MFDPKSQAVASLTYRRYGEAPSWYALGHSSVTELTGYAFKSTKFIPLHVRNMVEEVSPYFLLQNLIPDTFDMETDLPDNYRSWYSYLNPWQHEKVRRLRH